MVTARPRSAYLTHRDKDGHWLKVDGSDSFDGARIIGCHCGFMADPDDDGYGDSVLDHFEDVVRSDISELIDSLAHTYRIEGDHESCTPYREGWDDGMQHAAQIALSGSWMTRI